VVKFGTKIGYFNLQKTQNLSRGFKMAALKQRIFVCHLERAGSVDLTNVRESCIQKKAALHNRGMNSA